MADSRIGLIAGSGQLPKLFAVSAKKQGLSVIAVGHVGETDPSLEALVDEFTWVKVAQVGRIVETFKRAGVHRAAMAGAIGKLAAFSDARPDWGALQVLVRVKAFKDDALLRAVANYFEEQGITIVAPTDFLKEVFAPEGLLAGKALDALQQRDVEIGIEAALAVGRVDIGQTVVVKRANVLAVEAAEGTDQAIRRGGELGGAGAVVVKLCKLGQDERFDLPTVGETTLRTMAEVKANVLAIEAGRTVLLEADKLYALAAQLNISILGVSRPNR